MFNSVNNDDIKYNKAERSGRKGFRHLRQTDVCHGRLTYKLWDFESVP